jgi:arylsulfatase A-like enzyme
MSFTGYFRETTPFMDSLKLKFRAISAAPWTYPSVASLFTGLYPSVHNANLGGEVKYFNAENSRYLQPLRKNVLTLLEILHILGYDVIFSTTVYVVRQALKGRGVPRIYFGKPSAGSVLNDHKKVLSNARQPFFAYIHLGDLHIPINVPRGFKHFFGKVKKLPNINKWAYTSIDEQKGRGFKEYMENRILLYDNALRYVDSVIEDFYAFLQDKGLLDNTVFIVTADHGEEFWEHAELEAKNFYNPRNYHGVDHGHNLFMEIIEVPILLDGGALMRKGDFSKFLVSSVDVAPTIFDLIGIENNLPFNGVSLFNAHKLKDRPLLSESIAYGYEKKTLIMGDYKLLYSPRENVKWLFDLDKDPKELNPITGDELVNEFISRLEKFILKSRLQLVKGLAKRPGI